MLLLQYAQSIGGFQNFILYCATPYYEHGGNPFKGLHRWYSRKPLSFSRASVLGSLLPADVPMAEFEYLLGLEPGREVKLYKTPPGSVRIKKVQDLCEQVWGTWTPTVLDAFAGVNSVNCGCYYSRNYG